MFSVGSATVMIAVLAVVSLLSFRQFSIKKNKMVGLGIKSGMNHAGGGNASPGEFNSALFVVRSKKGG